MYNPCSYKVLKQSLANQKEKLAEFAKEYSAQETLSITEKLWKDTLDALLNSTLFQVDPKKLPIDQRERLELLKVKCIDTVFCHIPLFLF